MLCNFLGNPLRNPDFLHAHRVWNHIGVIANAIDNRFLAELFQFFTGKLLAFIAASNMVACGTVKKTVVCAVFTAIANIIRKTAMTSIRERRASPTKQAAYRCTFFVRYSVHQ